MSPVAPARNRVLASRCRNPRRGCNHVKIAKADPERPAPHWMMLRGSAEAAPKISAQIGSVPVLPAAAPASRLPFGGGARSPRSIAGHVATSHCLRPLGHQAKRRHASGIVRFASQVSGTDSRSGSELHNADRPAPKAGSCANPAADVRGCRWISDQSPPLPLLRHCFVLVFT